MRKTSVLTFLFLFLGSTFLAFAQTSDGDLKSTHRTILREWLMANPNWRLAVEKDYDREMLKYYRQQEGARALPFYAARDFNGDRREDFAVILIDKKNKYGVAVFNAPFSAARQTTPAFFSGKLETGDILYYNLSSRRLLVGPYASDAGFKLTPRGKGYRVEFLMTDN